MEIEGQRYSHLIDPRTGLGLTTQRTATVHASSAMRADAWASALCVMELEPGLACLQGLLDVSARVSTGERSLESKAFRAQLRD